MSRHSFRSSHAGNLIIISMGWDRPLQGYFMVIEYIDIGENPAIEDVPYLWSNLDQDNSHPKQLDPFLEVLRTFQIGVPIEMIEEVKSDGENNTGNKEVVHSFDRWGRYCRTLDNISDNGAADQGHEQSEAHFACMPIKEKMHLKCPICYSRLLEVGSNYFKPLGQKYLCSDGDLIHLPGFGKDGYDWNTICNTGNCPWCLKSYYMIEILTICANVDDDFQDKYFRMNQDRGSYTNYIIVQAPHSWIVSKFDTDEGIMLAHTLGLYANLESEYVLKISEMYRQFRRNLGSLNSVFFANTNPYFKNKVLK